MTQDAVAGGGERRREIDRGRRLADPALLVGERDDAGAARAGTARGSASSLARLTGDLLQAKNDPPPVGQALFDRHVHCPGFAREGQFLRRTARPLETGRAYPAPETARPNRASGRAARRRARSRHRRGGAVPPGSGMARIVTSASVIRAASRRKRGFARIGLDQLDTGNPEDRQHEAREARRRCRDRSGLRAGLGTKRQKLRRIEDVPAPQIGEGVAADQVDARRPPGQQRRHRPRDAPVFHVKQGRARQSLPARAARSRRRLAPPEAPVGG